MEADEVITGIGHFFRDLLPSAYFYAEWNEESMTNAFHWAKFCEQIYKNYYDKPSKDKLDELIHSIGQNLENENKILCFEDLKNCISALSEAFSGNPFVENNLIQSVLSKINYEKSSVENQGIRPELDSICIELLEALKPIKIVDSERSLYNEVKAEIFLNALKDATHYLTTEDQVEKYLSSSLEKLCGNADDMELLLHALMIKLPEGTSSVKEIQEFATNWLMFKVISDEHSLLSHFIWKQPSQLRAISLNSSDFLAFYLDFLTRCASSLSLELQSGETVWTQRFSERNALSFDDILIHFRCLLGRDNDGVSDYTKKHLLDLLNSQPGSLIWKEIFSRIT